MSGVFKMRSSGIGGQAVIEGIMMKNKDKYSVAVRKPDNTIEVVEHEYVSLMEKYAILKLPILRGVASFVESLIIGMKTLTYSASSYEDEEEPGKAERAAGRICHNIKDGSERKSTHKTCNGSSVLCPRNAMHLLWR